MKPKELVHLMCVDVPLSTKGIYESIEVGKRIRSIPMNGFNT